MAIRLCPVCGANHRRELYRPPSSPGGISRCLDCGMVYVADIQDRRALVFDGPVLYEGITPDVLTARDLSAVRGSWELALLPDKEREWPALRRNAIEALGRIEAGLGGACAGRHILDLGSGWGFFLAAAQARGWQAHGLEPLPASSVYARAVLGLDVVTDTLHDDTFPADSFDAVTSFQVFEHLPNPGRNLRSLRGMVRRGGLVLIEVPNVDTWTMALLGPRHRHFVQDHLNFFSRYTLGRLLIDSGFAVVDVYRPTRYMSLHHLNRFWMHRYVPQAIARRLAGTAERHGLSDRVIGVNLGDMIAMVARRM